MLIMDLQMKKRQILKDILLCREELVQCDRNEITELTRSSTEMQGSKTFVAGDEEDEEAGDHVSNLPNFSPAVREHLPGTSSEKMYENQRLFNKGLVAMKGDQSQQLEAILALKARLNDEAMAAEKGHGGSANHLIDSPIQSAIYTVQEMIADLGNDKSQDNTALGAALGEVLATLTKSNAYMPAFDFSKAKEDLAETTQSWLVTTFGHEAGVESADADAPLAAIERPIVDGITEEDIAGLDTVEFNCWAMSDTKYESLLMYMFKSSGMLERFRVPEATAAHFISEAHKGYRNNPYHNFRHAFDVTQMTYVLTRKTEAGRGLSGLEHFALMLTALCHDIDHGGKTNDFLIQTEAPLALLYNMRSINENHHSTVTFKLLATKEANMLGGLTLEQKRSTRKMMISCFMATDMTQHATINSKFALRCTDGAFNSDSPEDRLLLLNSLLHAADLGNPSRPFDMAIQWATVMNQEWWQEGDLCKMQGVPIGPMSHRPTEDRLQQHIAGTQIGFSDFVIAPFLKTLQGGLGPLMGESLKILASNRERYVQIKETGIDPGPKPQPPALPTLPAAAESK